MGSRRHEWAERVQRWRRSGLTANRFAASIGVNAATLSHWAWQLGREERLRGRGSAARGREGPAFVEVVGAAVTDRRFELQLENGRRLHVPPDFETAALERLLAVLEAAR